MTTKPDDTHTIKFIKVRNGDRVNYGHEGRRSHLIGVIPTPGREASAWLIYAVHSKRTAPYKLRDAE